MSEHEIYTGQKNTNTAASVFQLPHVTQGYGITEEKKRTIALHEFV